MTVSEHAQGIDDVRLWAARHGSGPPMVLLHGGPGLWDGFDALAAMVDDLVEVHRYDQRGGGRSERRGPYDVATFVADLEALRAHWGHDRWIVGGHSAGANLALAYAAEHPDRIRAVVYISGTGLIDDWSVAYHANADARRTPAQRTRRAELRAMFGQPDAGWTEAQDREYCALTWMADFADRDRAYETALGLYRPPGPSAEVNAAMNADWKRLLVDEAYVARLRAVPVPLLVLHGAADPRPPRLAERLAATLPDARAAIVPDAGHFPWLEQPKVTRRTLRTFLKDLTQRRKDAKRER